MSKELIFYTNPRSRGGIVHWMLEEIGCPYRVEVKEYGTTMKAPDYLAINPMGKVPAIKHGDTVVTETPAILAYLADAFPEAGLAPAPAERGEYYRWLFFGAGCMERPGPIIPWAGTRPRRNCRAASAMAPSRWSWIRWPPPCGARPISPETASAPRISTSAPC